MRQTWPAPERNKEPILEVLRQYLSTGTSVLEVASGTGQHAAHFAAALAGASWQPTDHDAEHHASIAAWSRDLPNVLPPISLDVMANPWPLGDAKYNAVYCANMIHIAPFEACLGLLRGAGAHLRSVGYLFLYGPFRIDGAHTSKSNEEFDLGLKARDPRWGVRDLEVVEQHAQSHGLVSHDRVAMPANNQLVVFVHR